MNPRFWVLLCLVSLPAVCIAKAQHGTTNTESEPPANRSVAHNRLQRSPNRARSGLSQNAQNAISIERYVTSVRFEDDGTGERDLSVRMRIESAAGAQQLRALSFDYNSASEKMELGYLRVRKPGGAVVNSPASAATNEPIADASALKNAPAYVNERQFHIALPSFAPGDTLEYEVVTRIMKPAAPGQFWFQHNFLSNASARDERLEISVPANRAVIVRSPHFVYKKFTEGGRAIYLWKHADIRGTLAAKSNERKSASGEAHPPDVQVTSFANWAAVARWYASLERGRSEPDAAIRAKTMELTLGASTDLAKIQAVYDYVSKTIRHVEISFGADGYQPRSAAEIFSTGYADAKDEQVLLAAMLQSAGFHVNAALIPYVRKLDLEMPSPAQFQHVVTAVPLSERTIWMDSTVGLAPFGLLPAPLRGKAALLISSDGSGQIVTTPADPAFRSLQQVVVESTVSPLGMLSGRVHYSLLGDTELALRLAFQNTPQAQWNELGQTVLAFDGIRGQVTSVKPDNLGDFEKPFEFDINFTESNFFDWSAKSTTAAMPLLAIGLPNPPQKHGEPVDIGSPLTVDVKLHLQLPENFAARPPVGTSVSRDFADFRSSYSFAGRVLSAERSLSFKLRELPATRLSDYLAFTRAVTLDQNQPLAIEYTGSGKPALPESVTPEQLISAGEASLNAGNAQSAIPLFQRALQIDPKYKDAWNDLGLAYMHLGKESDAISAFREQLQVNPADEHAGNYLGAALERQQDFDGAMAAFRKQAEDHPLDPVAHAALGELLVEQHQYAAAIPELEKGGVLAPRNPEIQIALGRAYLNLDKIPEAANAFDHAARIAPTPPVLNEIAYQFASRKIALDKAQQYAEAAISATAEDLRGVDLAHVTPDQIEETSRLGTYWDTLGWVYFQQGDAKGAEAYARASWLLNFNGEAGDHLAQIYEKLGEKERAVDMYALALAAPSALPDTRARLTLLLGGNSRIEELVARAKPELEKLRTIPTGKFDGHEDAHADFLLLLSPGGKIPRVDGIRFLSGNQALRPLGQRLRSLDFGEIFPDASHVELIRRGTLGCSAKSRECYFTLALRGAAPASN
jgi:tetratricopeptide (TPR) repeat protein